MTDDNGDHAMRNAVLTDIAVGIAAGIIASAAMHAFQTAVIGQFKELSQGEPATAKAAETLSRTVLGHSIPKKAMSAASNAVHYLTGAMLGGLYGLLAGISPAVTLGSGLAFGAGIWFFGDESAVPALGFGPKASATPFKKHIFGAASHAVFATTLDFLHHEANAHIAAAQHPAKPPPSSANRVNQSQGSVPTD